MSFSNYTTCGEYIASIHKLECNKGLGYYVYNKVSKTCACCTENISTSLKETPVDTQ